MTSHPEEQLAEDYDDDLRRTVRPRLAAYFPADIPDQDTRRNSPKKGSKKN